MELINGQISLNNITCLFVKNALYNRFKLDSMQPHPTHFLLLLVILTATTLQTNPKQQIETDLNNHASAQDYYEQQDNADGLEQTGDGVRRGSRRVLSYQEKKKKLLKLMYLIQKFDEIEDFGDFHLEGLQQNGDQHIDQQEVYPYEQEYEQFNNNERYQQNRNYKTQQQCQHTIHPFHIKTTLTTTYPQQLSIQLTYLQSRKTYKSSYPQQSPLIPRRLTIDDLFRKLCDREAYWAQFSVSAWSQQRDLITVSGAVVRVPVQVVVEGLKYYPVVGFELEEAGFVESQAIYQYVGHDQKGIKNQQNHIHQINLTLNIQQQLKQTIDINNVTNIDIKQQKQSSKQIEDFEKIQQALIQNQQQKQQKQKKQEKNRARTIESMVTDLPTRKIPRSQPELPPPPIIKQAQNRHHPQKDKRYSTHPSIQTSTISGSNSGKFKSIFIALFCLLALYLILKPKKVRRFPSCLRLLDRRFVDLRTFEYTGDIVRRRAVGDWAIIVYSLSIKDKNTAKIRIRSKGSWPISIGITQLPPTLSSILSPTSIITYSSNSTLAQNSTMIPNEGLGFRELQTVCITVDTAQNSIKWQVDGLTRFMWKAQANLGQGDWRFCVGLRGLGDQVELLQNEINIDRIIR